MHCHLKSAPVKEYLDNKFPSTDGGVGTYDNVLTNLFNYVDNAVPKATVDRWSNRSIIGAAPAFPAFNGGLINFNQHPPYRP